MIWPSRAGPIMRTGQLLLLVEHPLATARTEHRRARLRGRRPLGRRRLVAEQKHARDRRLERGRISSHMNFAPCSLP